jgi:NADH-quinone oxidoreductase subunit N
MDSYIFKTFLTEFFLLIAILSALLYNAFLVSSSKQNFPLLDKETFVQSIFIMFISLVISLGIDFGGISILNLFTNDITALSIKSILLFTVIGALICGKPYFISRNINLYEYYIIVLLAVFSLLFLASATDLISIYLCLEMQSLCFYILASFNRYSVFSTEAGLKYFVLGAFASCLFLFGSSLLYGITGTTNLSNFALLFSEGLSVELDLSIFFLGIIFLLITLLFKLTAAPFHIWSPDVYEGSPLNSTIIFVLVPKIIFLLLIFRLFYSSFFIFFSDFRNLFLICGILSVLLGSFLALRQKRLKKLLIYSSISHVGFILLAFSTGSYLGVVSVFYYIIFYIITGFLLWGVCSIYSNKTSLYLTDFASLSKNNPAISIAIAIAFFSLAGIPPLVGFSMKFFIFSAAIEAHLFDISLLIILLSVVGGFYYLRVVKILFFEKEEKQVFLTENLYSQDMVYILVAISFFIIVFGFLDPSIFLLYSYKIVLGLMSI